MASSSSTSSSTTSDSDSNPASAPAPSAPDGALHPANPAVSAGGGPNREAAPSDSAATSSSTISNRSSASALVPSAAGGARHPANPAVSAAGGPNRQATTSDPSASSSTASNVSKEAWPALIDRISPSKGVGRGTAPPASSASPSRSLGAAAAASRAAARQPAPTYETSWGSKGRVPMPTGFHLLRNHARRASPSNNRSRDRGSSSTAAKGASPSNNRSRDRGSSSTAAKGASPSNNRSRDRGSSSTAAKGASPSNNRSRDRGSSSTAAKGASPSNNRSRDRGLSSTAAKGGYEGWEAAPAPYPTSSIPPKKAWGSPQLPPRLPSCLAPSNSTAAAATGAPTGASHSSHATVAAATGTPTGASPSSHAPAGHDSSSSSAEASSTAAVALAPLHGGFAGRGDVLGHPSHREPVGLWKRCFNCLVNRAEMPVGPCGHIVLCAPCYERRERCPSCNMLIKCKDSGGRHA